MDGEAVLQHQPIRSEIPQDQLAQGEVATRDQLAEVVLVD